MKNLLDIAQIEKSQITPINNFFKDIKGVNKVNGYVKGDLYGNELQITNSIISIGNLKINSNSPFICEGIRETNSAIELNGYNKTKLINLDKIFLIKSSQRGEVANSYFNSNSNFYMNSNGNGININKEKVEVNGIAKIGKISEKNIAIKYDGEDDLDILTIDSRKIKSVFFDLIISCERKIDMIKAYFNIDQFGIIKEGNYINEYFSISNFKQSYYITFNLQKIKKCSISSSIRLVDK